ncbi:MAG: hypothetical protein K0Q87_1168 [Neobacillus sp.]|jgi:hypothetical protein|nr:hypothetical protein [Neobacillus sp.]
MKKRFLLVIAIMSLLGFTACNQESIKPDVDKPIVEPEPEPAKVYQNEAFQQVVISDTEASYVVKGKARVFEGVFQYAVVAGEDVLLQDNYQTDGAPAWGDFEISIDKGFGEKEGVVMELFVYSAKDGEKVDVLTIPLPNK